MKPLEINKKIALLKNFISDDKNYDDMEEFEYIQKLFPNWAENISDAWQLFEEMQVSILTKDRYNGAYSQGKWLCTYETLCPEEVLMRGPQNGDFEARAFWDDPHWVVAAQTAPMAICLAYIAWKQ